MDITQSITTASLKDLAHKQRYQFALVCFTLGASRERISRGEEANLKDIFQDFNDAFQIPPSERLCYRDMHYHYTKTLERITA